MPESEDTVKRGRPPKGSALVDGLDGSEHARERLRLILDTIAGKVAVEDACRWLDISEARFHEMRVEVLQTAMGRLEPAPAGRPPQRTAGEPSEVSSLKDEIRNLKQALVASQLREELAIALPAYFGAGKRQPTELKKTKKPAAPPEPPKAPEGTSS